MINECYTPHEPARPNQAIEIHGPGLYLRMDMTEPEDWELIEHAMQIARKRYDDEKRRHAKRPDDAKQTKAVHFP